MNEFSGPRSERPVLHLPRSGVELMLEALAAGGLLFMLLHLAGAWGTLPEEIPLHFGFSGTPDATGPRWTAIILPGVGLLLYIVFTVLSRVPHRANYLWPITPENAPRQYRLARTFLTLVKGQILWFFGFLLHRKIGTAAGVYDGLGAAFLPIFLVVTFLTMGGYVFLAYRAR